jgi:hypothetical protein
LGGTVQTAAHTRAAPISTPADDAAPVITPLDPINLPSISSITRLKPDGWTKLLIESGIYDDYKHIPLGLTEGFRIGNAYDTLADTYIPANYFTTDTDTEIIRTKFKEEIDLGRLAGPFHVHQIQHLLGNFRTAPMAVIQQGSKNHIVIDHSFP